ncbi:MAG: hydantoinase/oxoprolinase family protein [Gammaproteobacteria bacterium]|nr:hydantoinase/oxoprolinase family protein [Gammaproteobacteria bacterium]NNJ48880.1 hydantoinase/oxoprolinase family protein [Gammaproteobacteria bacterium]
MAKFLGVDTGGTFTDFILFDDTSRSIHIHKVLSTPDAPERAILRGIDDLARVDAELDSSDLTVIHGSTVATNAVLEGKGVRTAYITNRGLADVLSIGRQAREELYNLTPIKKPPLIERELCVEVNSRLSAQGEHLQQLDEQDLSALTEQLEALAPEAVAINLLFSFFDDSEELKVENAIAGMAANKIFISRSSDVLPEYKEFERGMTTALNAKVGPLMQGYLQRLESELGARGEKNVALSIMQSSSGTTSALQAGRYPVNLLLSGPAGGLKGAQYVAGASGDEQLLSFDMGGTSTDVSIIDREIGFTTGAKIGGYPVAVPMVDMHTIGAGGGSIARVDAGGLLLVGPESAGASPGPACYGKGGRWPTVTDANVVLGRLLPQAFLGGDMQLDKAAAVEAVNTVTTALGLSTEQAARGIIDVVNDHMVRALRVMSVERGEDPKDFILVSFGGAGGLHVCALAEELEMSQALVPVNAGVLSALGMLAAEASRERSRTINKSLEDCESASIDKIFEELLAHAVEELGAVADSIRTILTVDVRYQGQSNALNLPWQGLQAIEQAFHRKHKDSYGHDLDIDIELVNLRVRVIETRQAFELPAWQPWEELKITQTTLPGSERPVPVINRAGLQVGQKVDGPALITEVSATTWLAKGWSALVDDKGSLRLSVSR